MFLRVIPGGARPRALNTFTLGENQKERVKLRLNGIMGA